MRRREAGSPSASLFLAFRPRFPFPALHRSLFPNYALLLPFPMFVNLSLRHPFYSRCLGFVFSLPFPPLLSFLVRLTSLSLHPTSSVFACLPFLSSSFSLSHNVTAVGLKHRPSAGARADRRADGRGRRAGRRAGGGCKAFVQLDFAHP